MQLCALSLCAPPTRRTPLSCCARTPIVPSLHYTFPPKCTGNHRLSAAGLFAKPSPGGFIAAVRECTSPAADNDRVRRGRDPVPSGTASSRDAPSAARLRTRRTRSRDGEHCGRSRPIDGHKNISAAITATWPRSQTKLACESARVDEPFLRACVQRWMEQAPLPLLSRYTQPGLIRFLEACRARRLRLGALSDYPADAKLQGAGHCRLLRRGALRAIRGNRRVQAGSTRPASHARASQRKG